jgi:hypothetical protein
MDLVDWGYKKHYWATMEMISLPMGRDTLMVSNPSGLTQKGNF